MTALLLMVACQADEWMPSKKGTVWTYEFSSETGAGALKVSKRGTELCTVEGVEEIDGKECLVLQWRVTLEGGAETDRVKLWVRVDAEGIVVAKMSEESWRVVPASFKKRDKKIEMQAGSLSVSTTCAKGEEEVKTPAGKFKAMKVTMEAGAGSLRTETVMWFAKGTGVVKLVTRSGAGAAQTEETLVLRGRP